MSSMSHMNGVVTNFKDDHINEESPLDEYDHGVCDLNHTPHLVKPLVLLKVSFCFIIMCYFYRKP
jgi:hypothetical protein